jgi:hypothetical protein
MLDFLMFVTFKVTILLILATMVVGAYLISIIIFDEGKGKKGVIALFTIVVTLHILMPLPDHVKQFIEEPENCLEVNDNDL